MKHNPRFQKLVESIMGGIQELDVEALNAKITQNESCLLIDVREQDEWSSGHIPTAIHLSKGIIERDIEKIAPNQQQKIILYCGGGYRSALAAHALGQMGYTQVLSVNGGMSAWRAKNYQIHYPTK